MADQPTDLTEDQKPPAAEDCSIVLPDHLVEIVTAATRTHALDYRRTDVDGHTPCVCGEWWDVAEDGPDWDEHIAEVVLVALFHACEVERSYVVTGKDPGGDEGWISYPDSLAEAERYVAHHGGAIGHRFTLTFDAPAGVVSSPGEDQPDADA